MGPGPVSGTRRAMHRLRNLRCRLRSGRHPSRRDARWVLVPDEATGRLGVLPGVLSHVKDSAIVVLDDAERETEKQCVEFWTEGCGLTCLGYVPIGHGFALFETNPRI